MCHRLSGERVHDTGVLHFTEITDIVVVSSGVWPRLTHLGNPDQSPVRDYSLQTASTGESNINKQFAKLDLTHKHIGTARTQKLIH